MATNSAIDTFKSLGLSTVDSASTKPTAKQNLGQEQFLKLLTTQLTHQDPMKPMESGDFLGQMAQFSTVSGIQDLQASFKSFADSVTSGQALQAAGLVGHYVSAPGEQALLSFDAAKHANGSIYGSFDLPSSSPDVTIKIIDPQTSDVVWSKDLGTLPAGNHNFDWNGVDANGAPANPGVYKVQVEAKIDNVNTVLATDVLSQVESVTMGTGSSGMKVNLLGLDSIPFNKIKQIL